MNKFVSIWCEWDIGQEGIVFAHEEGARLWCSKNSALTEAMEVEDFATVQDVIDAGLLSFKKLKVYD